MEGNGVPPYNKPLVRTLKAISLACKAFAPHAQRTLFRHVSLVLHERESQDFVTTFTANKATCQHFKALTVVTTPTSHISPRMVSNFILLLSDIVLVTVRVEILRQPGDNWKSKSSDQLRRLLKGLKYDKLVMGQFRCQHLIVLPRKPIGILRLEFDADDYETLLDDACPPKSPSLVITKELQVMDLVCIQFNPDPLYCSTRTVDVDPQAVEAHGLQRAIEEPREEEAKIIKGLFAALGGCPRLVLETCRLSSQALRAVFGSDMVRSLTGLYLRTVTSVKDTYEVQETPFCLSSLSSLTGLAASAVDDNLFSGCPPQLANVVIHGANVPTRFFEQLLGLQKAKSAITENSVPRCRISILAVREAKYKDGPEGVLSPAGLGSSATLEKRRLLDQAILARGHTFTGNSFFEVARRCAGLAGTLLLHEMFEETPSYIYLWPAASVTHPGMVHQQMLHEQLIHPMMDLGMLGSVHLPWCPASYMAAGPCIC